MNPTDKPSRLGPTYRRPEIRELRMIDTATLESGVHEPALTDNAGSAVGSTASSPHSGSQRTDSHNPAG